MHPYIDGILPTGPYPPCLRMADRARLAGYPRHALSLSLRLCHSVRLISFLFSLLHFHPPSFSPPPPWISLPLSFSPLSSLCTPLSLCILQTHIAYIVYICIYIYIFVLQIWLPPPPPPPSLSPCVYYKHIYYMYVYIYIYIFFLQIWPLAPGVKRTHRGETKVDTLACVQVILPRGGLMKHWIQFYFQPIQH